MAWRWGGVPGPPIDQRRRQWRGGLSLSAELSLGRLQVKCLKTVFLIFLSTVSELQL